MGYDVPAHILKDRVAFSGDLEVMSNNAMKALVRHNEPPELFIRSGFLTTLRETDNGTILEIASEDALRGMLARAATFVKIKDDEDADELKFPPMAVVEYIRAYPGGWSNIPQIKGIVEAPIIHEDGSIVLTPGYDDESQLYYRSEEALEVSVPEQPSQEEAKAAMKFILDEVFVDFPFVRDGLEKENRSEIPSASKANVLAALLTPIMRPLINGPAPLALFDKPTEGSGATLLTEIISQIATGHKAKLMGFPKEEELEKSIVAALLQGNTILNLDEVNRKMKSAFMNRALTATILEARILGHSKTAELHVMVSWMCTGKNITASPDIIRRSYWIRIDAEQARPQDRDNFKHKNIRKWVTENRSLILSKILTIIRAWYIAGRPMANVPMMGSYESWSSLIGSILEFAGAQGFLENSKQLWENSDTESGEWEAFLKAWHEELGDKQLFVSELMTHIRGSSKMIEALPSEIAEIALIKPDDKETYNSAKKAFGKILGRYWKKRFMSKLYLDKKKDPHTDVLKWFCA